MSSHWFLVILEVSVIACGLVAGVFLTFSDFVMRSLDGAKTSAGIQAMQIINREVFKTVFMVLLLGWSALSPLLVIYAWFYLTGTAATLVMAGGLAYLIGVFIVSMVFNVPMNKRLDALEFTSPQAAQYWKTQYVPRWTFWNYVRAISSAAAATCFLIALPIV